MSSTAHVDEGLVVRNHLACSDEKGSKLGFSSQCHNKLDDLGDGEHRTVEARERIILREKYMSSGAGAPVRLRDWDSLRNPASA